MQLVMQMAKMLIFVCGASVLSLKSKLNPQPEPKTLDPSFGSDGLAAPGPPASPQRLGAGMQPGKPRLGTSKL